MSVSVEYALSFVPVRQPDCSNFLVSVSSHISAYPDTLENPRNPGLKLIATFGVAIETSSKVIMVLVAGIGIGLFVLIIIWTLTIVAVFVLAAVPKIRSVSELQHDMY